MRKLSLIVCSLLLLSLAACGGKDNEFPALPEGPGGATGGGTPPPPATASIMGKVSFEGEVPKAEKIQTSADPNCKKELHTEGTLVTDGGLANVFIYVSGGDLAGKSYAPPSTPVELNQQDCHYIPHAVVVQVGQEVSIKNSDMTLHNIHAFSEINEGFNTAQAVQGLITKHVFDKKEIIFPVKCEVHKWMQAFIAVVDNPWATVSTEGGKYELKLPAG